MRFVVICYRIFNITNMCSMNIWKLCPFFICLLVVLFLLKLADLFSFNGFNKSTRRTDNIANALECFSDKLDVHRKICPKFGVLMRCCYQRGKLGRHKIVKMPSIQTGSTQAKNVQQYAF